MVATAGRDRKVCENGRGRESRQRFSGSYQGKTDSQILGTRTGYLAFVHCVQFRLANRRGGLCPNHIRVAHGADIAFLLQNQLMSRNYAGAKRTKVLTNAPGPLPELTRLASSDGFYLHIAGFQARSQRIGIL